MKKESSLKKGLSETAAEHYTIQCFIIVFPF